MDMCDHHVCHGDMSPLTGVLQGVSCSCVKSGATGANPISAGIAGSCVSHIRRSALA